MKTPTSIHERLMGKEIQGDIVIPTILWVCIIVGFVIIANAFAAGS